MFSSTTNPSTERCSRPLTRALNTDESKLSLQFLTDGSAGCNRRLLSDGLNLQVFFAGWSSRPRGTVGDLCRKPIGGLWLPRGRSAAGADHVPGVSNMVSVSVCNSFDDSAGQSAQAAPSRVLFASVSRRVHALIITKGMANGEKTEGEKVHPNG